MQTLIALLIVAVVPVVAAQGPAAGDIGEWMARVGERVTAYYARAQSIICEETVRLEPLGRDFLSNGDHVRTLVYELRVEWSANTDGQPANATVVRRLLSVDGRPPRPGEEPGCFDRQPISPEPLEMFLPSHQREYLFTWKGASRENGRPSITIEYRATQPKPAVVTAKGDCLSVDLVGHTRGRVWVDPSTADILRLDEALSGPYDFRAPGSRSDTARRPTTFTIERLDSSISYRPVTFHDPDETLLLPASVVSLQVITNAGIPRLRTYQTFAKYRRFITDARIVQ